MYIASDETNPEVLAQWQGRDQSIILATSSTA